MSDDLGESDELALELAAEAVGDHQKEPWFDHAAFSSMVLAMVMTVGALYAGIAANQAIADRQRELLDESEAHLSILVEEMTKNRLLLQASSGEEGSEELIAAVEKYEEDAEKDQQAAEEDLSQSEAVYEAHEILAFGVTLMSIGVTMTGMSIVIRKKHIWMMALVFASIGLVLILFGLITYFLIPSL